MTDIYQGFGLFPGLSIPNSDPSQPPLVVRANTASENADFKSWLGSFLADGNIATAFRGLTGGDKPFNVVIRGFSALAPGVTEDQTTNSRFDPAGLLATQGWLSTPIVSVDIHEFIYQRDISNNVIALHESKRELLHELLHAAFYFQGYSGAALENGGDAIAFDDAYNEEIDIFLENFLSLSEDQTLPERATHDGSLTQFVKDDLKGPSKTSMRYLLGSKLIKDDFSGSQYITDPVGTSGSSFEATFRFASGETIQKIYFMGARPTSATDWSKTAGADQIEIIYTATSGRPLDESRTTQILRDGAAVANGVTVTVAITPKLQRNPKPSSPIASASRRRVHAETQRGKRRRRAVALAAKPLSRSTGATGRSAREDK